MKDLFDHIIFCTLCNVPTHKGTLLKDGFTLRVLTCPSCTEISYHPGDLKDYEDFKRLKDKDFDVKLRMVGNSFCVSIPKELIDFHKNLEEEFNKLVRLNLDQPGRISIFFKSERFYNPPRDLKD